MSKVRTLTSFSCHVVPKMENLGKKQRNNAFSFPGKMCCNKMFIVSCRRCKNVSCNGVFFVSCGRYKDMTCNELFLVFCRRYESIPGKNYSSCPVNSMKICLTMKCPLCRKEGIKWRHIMYLCPVDGMKTFRVMKCSLCPVEGIKAGHTMKSSSWPVGV